MIAPIVLNNYDLDTSRIYKRFLNIPLPGIWTNFWVLTQLE